MAISAKLVSLFSVGVVGVAGSAYVGTRILNSSSEKKMTFGDRYKGTLITSSSTDDSKWEARKTKLTSDNSVDMDASLKEIKSRNPLKKEDIEGWCSGISSSPFEESSTKIKGFEIYCVYTIKEKIGSTFIVDAQSSSGINANTALKNKGRDNLPESLRSIFDQLSPTATATDANALQKYCHGKQDDVFRGEDDDLYKELSSYCVNTVQ